MIKIVLSNGADALIDASDFEYNSLNGYVAVKKDGKVIGAFFIDNIAGIIKEQERE